MIIPEQYRPITGFDGYEISNHGRVRNANGKILKGYTAGRGYKVVKLFKDGTHKQLYLHRLVATEFIPNPENKSQVNHLDCNPENNYIRNLEWATPLENCQHKTINKFFDYVTQLPPMTLERWLA
jgi:hypothetical protein